MDNSPSLVFAAIAAILGIAFHIDPEIGWSLVEAILVVLLENVLRENEEAEDK